MQTRSIFPPSSFSETFKEPKGLKSCSWRATLGLNEVTENPGGKIISRHLLGGLSEDVVLMCFIDF